MKQLNREYSTYLFDADGTLFDTTEMIIRCFAHSATVNGLPVPGRDAVIRHVGRPLRQQMEEYFGAMDDAQFAKLRKVHMEFQLKIYRDHLTLCPGVAEALEALVGRGKTCAVVTSRMAETLTLYLRETKIDRFFSALVTPAETTRHKPEPEPALAAMKLVHAVPDDTLFTGDATFDVECGSRAGCSTAFVTWSGTRVEDLSPQPDYLVDDMRDLCVW